MTSKDLIKLAAVDKTSALQKAAFLGAIKKWLKEKGKRLGQIQVPGGLGSLKNIPQL